MSGHQADAGRGSKPAPTGAERRRHARAGAGGICLLTGENGAEAGFELVDLSESGARLRCDRGLKPMTRVGVVLMLPRARLGRDEDVRLDIQGVVVWSHQTESSGYDTGVFFPELDRDARNALKAFVDASV